MRRTFSALLPLCLFFVAHVPAQQLAPASLSACGPADQHFRAGTVLDATDPDHPAPSPTRKQNFNVYFINDNGPDGDEQHYTLRLGVDGAWVGAYIDNAYFGLQLPAGEHHACINVQTNRGPAKYAFLHLLIKEGQPVYIRTRFLSGLGAYPSHPVLGADFMDDDQAKYLLSIYPAAVWHRHK